MTRRSLLLQAGVLQALLISPVAAAPYTIGSGNTANIAPAIVVPKEKPCVVKLINGASFGATNATYTYTPPSACPGPWARVVLDVDIAVQAGIQYDRTGTLWMAGVPLWFGTTSEPNPLLGPSWHVERDVTEYSALFAAPQTGFELIANYTNSTDTSLITSSARLRFYPPTKAFPAPAEPDMVLPFSAAGGGTVALGTPTDALSTTVTLPTHVQSASLAVYLQGQSGDEFWYTCVPNAYATQLESCGGGAFREGEITVDNTPAGVAPVYPWIFTGGIDPYLWAPLPGVQTLSFTPFTVPLSPFAGVLSDGNPHTISLSVAGANNFFSAAGALFVTLDPNSTTITGKITRNTLAAAPKLRIVPKISSGTNTTGNILTTATHDFTIVGEQMTAAGRVTNTVTQSTSFRNDQEFDIAGPLDHQVINQLTQTSVADTAVTEHGASSETRQTYTYPLAVRVAFSANSAGNGYQATSIDQQRQYTRVDVHNGQPTNQSSSAEAIQTADTLLLKAGNLAGNEDMASTESLLTTGTTQPCVDRKLTAAMNMLKAYSLGCGTK